MLKRDIFFDDKPENILHLNSAGLADLDDEAALYRNIEDKKAEKSEKAKQIDKLNNCVANRIPKLK